MTFKASATQSNEGETLDEYLARRAADRQAKYKTVLVETFPDVTSLSEMVYLGVLSWTLPVRAERWLKPGAVVNIGNGLQTAGEIARDYLDFKHPNKLRATGAQARALNLHRSAPLYCEPSVIEFASYVDLKSAFWSIMNIVGWNVDYFPGRWLVKGDTPHDFPLSTHKVARNALVSCGLPTPMRMWTGKKFARQYRRNPHINMGLWSCIMDTLHSIAGHALRLGSCYVHTDGYILPGWDANDLQARIAEFGLTSSIKASGLGVVLGMGNWRVGDKSTKFYGRETSVMGEVEHVYATHYDKLQSKFAHLAKYADTYKARQDARDMREYEKVLLKQLR